MSHTERDLKEVSRLLQANIRESTLPQPEEPFLKIYYDPRSSSWSAQVGSEYAGYFDAQAEVPVYLGESFTTLAGLIAALRRALIDTN